MQFLGHTYSDRNRGPFRILQLIFRNSQFNGTPSNLQNVLQTIRDLGTIFLSRVAHPDNQSVGLSPGGRRRPQEDQKEEGEDLPLTDAQQGQTLVYRKSWENNMKSLGKEGHMLPSCSCSC